MDCKFRFDEGHERTCNSKQPKMSSELLLYLHHNFTTILFPNNAFFGYMKIIMIPKCSSSVALTIY